MAEWPNGETLNEIYGLMETEYNSPFSSVMVHQISNHNHRKLAKNGKSGQGISFTNGAFNAGHQLTIHSSVEH